MLVTYCAVKLMEIFNRKNNFSDLREVSVLGLYSSDCVYSKEVANSFSLRRVIFSLCCVNLYVFPPCVTLLSERTNWKLIQFTFETNMSITRSDSGVSKIR
jgi:hypothetical protein